MTLFTRFVLLFLFPVVVHAQSRKAEFNVIRELGFTGHAHTVGGHFNWQGQVSRNFYLGAGAELLRTRHDYKEWVQKDLVVPAMFRLSYVSRLERVRLVPYLAAGVVLSQPTGTGVEAGTGLAVSNWQLTASYRWYKTNKELPSIDNGLYFRFSRLFIRKATNPRFKKSHPEEIKPVNK